MSDKVICDLLYKLGLNLTICDLHRQQVVSYTVSECTFLSSEAGDIVTTSSMRPSVRTYVYCNNNTRYLHDNSKSTGEISSNFFVDTLGTLGQRDFAFGLCGSIGGRDQ